MLTQLLIVHGCLGENTEAPQNFNGFQILGVPIEGWMFASTGGAIWSAAYEYLEGYRLTSGQGVHLARVQGG